LRALSRNSPGVVGSAVGVEVGVGVGAAVAAATVADAGDVAGSARPLPPAQAVDETARARPSTA
jgi:hypothetical protein